VSRLVTETFTLSGALSTPNKLKQKYSKTVFGELMNCSQFGDFPTRQPNSLAGSPIVGKLMWPSDNQTKTQAQSKQEVL
jgi:hypothetical protein